jgi:hypothetical protein
MRFHAQNGVRVLTDERKRGPTPGFALGVELFVADLPFDFAHLTKV